MSLPAIAATLGIGRLGAAEALPGAPADKDLGARVYNVREFGAKGDGVTVDTAAVQAAIDACTRDQGGTVLVPAGDFIVGTIELKSYVTLHLAAKGRLLGSPNIKDYHAGRAIPPGNGNITMISAADAENITIEGNGTIDGNGAKFYTGQGDNTGPSQNSAAGYFARPHLLVFHACKNLRIRDVFLTASAYHCLRILECIRVHIDGARIYNRVNKNNDGFHIDASEHVHISNCEVACQDDACSLFGSNKFITVTNCTFSTRWSVFRFGGGEAENITVSNCVIFETYGCPIKMAFGRGSRAENIMFSNLIMKGVTGPISIGLDSSNRRRRPNAASTQAPRPLGIVRNITFSNIRATVVDGVRQHADLPFSSNPFPGETRTCIVLNGANEAVLENITLSDVHVTYEGGGTAEDAARRDVPQVAGEYFMIGTPPAYGLFARKVHGLTLDNVRFEVTKPDLRPAVVFDHVADATVDGLSAQGNPQAESTLRFIESRDTLLLAPRVLTPAAIFLQIEGATSANIAVQGGDLSKAATPLAFVRGATDKAARVT